VLTSNRISIFYLALNRILAAQVTSEILKIFPAQAPQDNNTMDITGSCTRVNRISVRFLDQMSDKLVTATDPLAGHWMVQLSVPVSAQL
jgi:hypothetical protein